MDVEKAAQIGFTESLIAITAFCLAKLKIPAAMGFEADKKLNQIVSERIQPSFALSPAIQKINQDFQKKIKRQDKDNHQAISVGGVVANFFHGKPNATAKESGGRQASSSLSSFPTCFMSLDEIALWDPGMIDVASKRMQATMLPMQPMRLGSTPGGDGSAADIRIKTAKYLFQWQVICPHCGTSQFLDAFDNYILSVEKEIDGRMETIYLDEIGKPLKWFHHDPEKPLDTAYIGCRTCDKELDRETIDAGHYVCRKTNLKAVDLCKKALEEQRIVESVALRAPRLACVGFNPARQIRKLVSDRYLIFSQEIKILVKSLKSTEHQALSDRYSWEFLE